MLAINKECGLFAFSSVIFSVKSVHCEALHMRCSLCTIESVDEMELVVYEGGDVVELECLLIN